MYDQPENSPNRLNATDSSAESAELQGDAPNYRLHDPKSIALATFFGSPLAGAALLALNYRWLQKGRAAALALVAGFVLTVLAITCGYLIPSTYATAVAVSLVVVMKSVANSLQGEAIKQHLQRGGRLASKWTAGGTGIGIGALLFGIIFAVEIARQMDSKIVIGDKDEVFYSGGATKTDAKTLGKALQTAGYFSNKGISVLFSKSGGGTVVSFVVKDGIWNQPEMISGFEEVGRQIAPEIGGFPITLRLTNGARTPMRELTVGRLAVGAKDEIYYYGSATEAEARALSQSLHTAKFFQDRGTTVFLVKDDDGTKISFVVAEGTWNREEHIAGFEALVRQSAPGVGGVPLKLRLVNARLEPKYVATIE